MGDTRKGERVALQAGNTFEIRHLGVTLKFQFHADTRTVELLSDEGDPGDPGDSGKAIPVFTSEELIKIVGSPRVAYDDLLRKLPESDSVFVSKVFFDAKDLQGSLVPLRNLSKDLITQRGVKPMVVVRVADKSDLAASDIGDLMQGVDADYDLDAHIVSIPGVTKKF